MLSNFAQDSKNTEIFGEREWEEEQLSAKGI